MMISIYQRFVKSLRDGKERWLGKERPSFFPCRLLFEDKIGLEIGGPSDVFQGKDLLPVYPCATRIDGVNFSTSTLWAGGISETAGYRTTDGRVGQQFVCEASKLERIADRTYDFVLSSHSLEHSANPLKCIAEWLRVLKPGGALLLLLPDARFTFDHRRPVTSFEHLLEDYRNDVGEDDLTHLEEILALHDLSQDPQAGSAESFRARSLRNIENRALHQHVFDAALLRQIYCHFNIRPLCAETAPPVHIIALGTSAPSGSGG
jgi:SAM-dependent methyltransferase